jgi:hypothetical protein
MARIDKVIQVVRGKAGTAFAADGNVVAVAVGTGGSIFPAGTAEALGVLIVNAKRGPYGSVVAAGDRVDVLRIGEVVEFGGTAGDNIYAGAAGALATSGSVFVGTVMDGGQRLVVTM